MSGNRKLKAFFATLGVMCGVIIVAVFRGTSLTGDNITAIMMILAAFYGAFAGANAGEHWAKRGAPTSSSGAGI